MAFSNFAKKQADSIGVTGFVTNSPDGHVEGEAQGSQSSLKEFVGHLSKGPSAASVSNVEQKELSAKDGESKFDVK
ncbi:hypothetical protein LTS18_002157 [Coniosporium uncinatum]|uniref:Uncharacterized protein n=1 Tax=Coniosporium uncinatum TaxID=93489 RepID=A0ACC3DUJ1_9PEZI|nr:hypothetical protein LTS18_002157 [Coniosporium uncinatum]